MPRKRLSVQVSASHLGRLSEVEAGLREAGMTIRDQIPAIGHYSGVADEAAAARVRAVPGVSAVTVHGDEGDPEPADYSIS